jgi:hypothetical protein
MKSITALITAIMFFVTTSAYSCECFLNNPELIMQLKKIGYQIEIDQDMNITITNPDEQTITINFNEFPITPDSGMCNILAFCIWFTFFIAYGIFWLPCLVAYYSNC